MKKFTLLAVASMTLCGCAYGNQTRKADELPENTVAIVTKETTILLNKDSESFPLWIDSANDMQNGSQSLQDNIDYLVDNGADEKEARAFLEIFEIKGE